MKGDDLLDNLLSQYKVGVATVAMVIIFTLDAVYRVGPCQVGGVALRLGSPL